MLEGTKATLSILALVLAAVAVLPVPVSASHGQTAMFTTDFTLTADFTAHVIMGADGITLDCAGFSVIGSGSGVGILLIERTGVTVKNCQVTNFVIGIFLFSSDANVVTGNTASANQIGFQLSSFVSTSSGNVLTGNTANGNEIGFRLTNAEDNVLTGNAVNGAITGFQLGSSDGNTFTGSTASDNLVGFRLEASSTGNIFTEGTVNDNQIGFVFGGGSSANTIFHNNIIDNNVQAFDFSQAANAWHHPVLKEGNFWSDYAGLDDGSGFGKHADAGDGIGDTLIPHPGPDFDNFPFTSPFSESISVDTDVKPGSDPNSINMKSKGKITVAILSTPDFDATTQVDKTSLTFGRTGDEQSLAKCTESNEDVNGDGLLDVACHFETQDTGFRDGDTEGILRGQTVDGIPIEGNDSVRILHG